MVGNNFCFLMNLSVFQMEETEKCGRKKKVFNHYGVNYCLKTNEDFQPISHTLPIESFPSFFLSFILFFFGWLVGNNSNPYL